MQRNLEEQLKEHTKLSSSLKLLVINMNSGILVDVISSLSENKITVLEDQLEEDEGLLDLFQFSFTVSFSSSSKFDLSCSWFC